MNEIEALERIFQRIRELPAAERERYRLVMEDMLAEPDDAAAFEREMQDPEYRAYVEQALEESHQDVLAGRTYTLDEVRRRSAERMKKLYG